MTVKAMKLDNQDKKIKQKQQEMFGNNIYPNIYICSQKGGGKTNLVAHIIKNLITSKTKIRIFSTTAYNDLTMKKLLEKLDKYEFEYEIFDSPIDKDGTDLIDKQFEETQKLVENEEEEYKKSKWYYPLYINVFDDMTSLLLKSKGFDRMLCRNRHIRTINVISNQYYNQISTVARQNINFLLLFRNIPEAKLRQVFDEKVAGRIKTFDEFLELYHEVTEEKYHFLYISDDGEFRRDFNIKIDLNKTV